MNPTTTATIEVTTKVIIVVNIILPSLLGLLILDIDVVIVRNIKGTIITKSILINTSPKGAKVLASSLNINPTSTPKIIAPTNTSSLTKEVTSILKFHLFWKVCY